MKQGFAGYWWERPFEKIKIPGEKNDCDRFGFIFNKAWTPIYQRNLASIVIPLFNRMSHSIDR